MSTRTMLAIIVTLASILIAVNPTHAATIYTPQQSSLYRAVDELAWYGHELCCGRYHTYQFSSVTWNRPST